MSVSIRTERGHGMTGTRCRFLEKRDRLNQLRERYRLIADNQLEVSYRARWEDDSLYFEVDKLQEQLRYVGDAIWREVFFTNGRDWNGANEYIHRNSISTH